MYPWDVLKISKTGDKKEIKKAYAKLLRQYRPEDDAIIFQRINHAYQSALATIDANSKVDSVGIQEHEDSILANKSQINIKHNNELTIDNIEVPKETVDKNQIQTQTLIHDLFELTQVKLKSPIEEREKLRYWHFLQNYHEIQDFTIRSEVSRNMFQMISDNILASIQNNQIMPIPIKVLNYFDEVFQWTANWQELQQQFPRHQINLILDLAQAKKGAIDPTFRPSVIRRSVAFFVDAWFFFMFASLIIYVSAPFLGIFISETFHIITILLGFFLYRVGFGFYAKGHQMPVAQKAGYRFLNSFLKKPSNTTVLKRELWLELKILPIYFSVFGLFHVDIALAFAGVLIIIDLVYSLFNGHRMLQDKLSGSLAVSNGKKWR